MIPYKAIILVITSYFLVTVSVSGQSNRFYVSAVDGDDNNRGSINHPFKTFEKAVKHVRKYITTGMEGDITVFFRGGTYFLKEPIVFSKDDVAKNGYKITYRNYEEEEVIISGGMIVDDWSSEEGVFKSVIPESVIPRNQNIRQLYSDGQKQVRARQPNVNEYFRTYKTQPNLSKRSIRFEKNLLDESASGNVEVCMNIAYSHHRLILKNIVQEDEYDTYTFKESDKIFDGFWFGVVAETKHHNKNTTTPFKNRDFWFENHPDFIDNSGEWHYDRATQVLSYLPISGNANNEKIVIPRLEQLIVFQGAPNSLSDYNVLHKDNSPWVNFGIELNGLKFMHTNGRNDINKSGLLDIQANFFQPFPENGQQVPVQSQYRKNRPIKRLKSAVDAFKANNIIIKNCSFTNLGGSGIKLDHGGSDCVIAGNFFHEIASSAIEIGTDMRSPDSSYVQVVPSNTVVTNNYIKNIATEYLGGVGILATYVNSIDISNNTIEHVPYVGIHFGWGWGDNACVSVAGSEQCLNTDNSIYGNKVLYACEKLYDCGGIYTNNVNPSTIIAENYVAHTDGYGLYLDQKSTGFSIHDNTLENNHTYNNDEKLGWIKENRTGPNIISGNSQASSIENCKLIDLACVTEGAGVEPEYLEFFQTQLTGMPKYVTSSKAVILASESDSGYSGSSWLESDLKGYKDVPSKFTDATDATASFRAPLAKGYYNIQFYNVVDPESDSQLQLNVHHATGIQFFTIDQKNGKGGWIDLGDYLITDCEALVEVIRKSNSSKGYSRISAVKYELISEITASETNLEVDR